VLSLLATFASGNHMRRRTFYAWLFVTFAALCSACGGGSDNSSATSNAYIRLVNATQTNDLTLSASTTAVNSNVGAGSASGYASLTSGTYSVIVGAANNALFTSATSSLGLSADIYYTVLAYARGGQIKLLTITDNKSAPATGYASVTITNADIDAGALDVYVVAPGTSVTDLSPAFTNVTAGSVSLTNSITAGTYDIVVTAYNKPNDVRLTMPSVTLTSTQIVTLALTTASGGSLVNGALVEQKGKVQLQAANKARVRVAGALPVSGGTNAMITTTVGGTALSAVTAPSVGTYGLVPANATSYTVNVNGAAVTGLSSTTFASGGDYTILVYGTAGAPQVSVLTDNNLLPTSGGAKIRLINGAVATGGLSLSDNFVPLVSELAYGTASAYSGVAAGSSLLQLTSPVSSFTSYSTTINILSNGVYTLFVLGSTDSALEIFSKDK
jgi:Domain of unknown function (DUF4397)